MQGGPPPAHRPGRGEPAHANAVPLVQGAPEERATRPVPSAPKRAGRIQGERGELPLPPVRRPAPAAVIQRQTAGQPAGGLGLAAQGKEIMQRSIVTRPETRGDTEEEQSELDLDDLAREVYPLIKRMLAIERERMPAR